jgi:hypothetical protein
MCFRFGENTMAVYFIGHPENQEKGTLAICQKNDDLTVGWSLDGQSWAAYYDGISSPFLAADEKSYLLKSMKKEGFRVYLMADNHVQIESGLWCILRLHPLYTGTVVHTYNFLCKDVNPHFSETDDIEASETETNDTEKN